MTPQSRGSVVVGVSGSLGSLEALRVAAAEARTSQRQLVAVLAWSPPGGDFAHRRAADPGALIGLCEREAKARLARAFDEAMGGRPPSDPNPVPFVVRGRPGPVLVEISDERDDLLVVGAGERRWPARLVHGATSRSVSRGHTARCSRCRRHHSSTPSPARHATAFRTCSTRQGASRRRAPCDTQAGQASEERTPPVTVSYPRAARQCRQLTIRDVPPSPTPSAAPAVPTVPDGPLVVDPLRRAATAGGRPLTLTRLEFDLLAHLVREPLRVFTRDQLLATVWGLPAIGDGRTVDVHMVRLRRNLGPAFRDVIATVRGVGYKYDPTRS